MAQKAHLRIIHNVQSEKVKDGVISGVKFRIGSFKGKFTAKFGSIAENVE
jgi:hypothetical protein